MTRMAPPRLPLREEHPSVFGQPYRSCYVAPAHDEITEAIKDIPPDSLRAEAKACKHIRAAQLARKTSESR